MILLGIETSCDDTAAALVEITGSKFRVIKNIVASQVKLHQKYGGVVPEVAARRHLETIIPVIRETMGRQVETRHASSLPDAIAVTAGPGLATSLHVGVETAKTLSLAWGVPLVGVNHIEGHIYSVFLPPSEAASLKPSPNPSLAGRGSISSPPFKGGVRGGFEGRDFPAIALIVSGGHTELILIKKQCSYKLLGRTRDDAAGECFDKAAAMLGLPYPGGPEISKRAAKGNPNAFELPRPMLDQDNFEFSFSGMKNAIRLLIEKNGRDIARNVSTKNNICASIEHAIVDVLVQKSLKAVAAHTPKTFILAGGVAANKKLRATLEEHLPKKTSFRAPQAEFCMDNAAMIAAAGGVRVQSKQFNRYDTLTANANWELAY